MTEKFQQNFVKKENNQKLSPMIEELRIPYQKILTEIKDSINKGEYETIIGDDGTGRIPTLILNNIVKNIYKDKKFESPKVLFYAAQKYHYLNSIKSAKVEKEIKESLIKNLTNKYPPILNSKVLISTDAIVYGGTLKPLINILKELDIKYDIVSLFFMSGDIDIRDYSEKIRHYEDFSEGEKEIYKKERENEIESKKLGSFDQIHIGKTTIGEPGIMLIYDEMSHDDENYPYLVSSGIMKEGAFPKTIIKSNTLIDKDFDTEKIKNLKMATRVKVNKAREEVKILSDQLTDWYRKNLEE